MGVSPASAGGFGHSGVTCEIPAGWMACPGRSKPWSPLPPCTGSIRPTGYARALGVDILKIQEQLWRPSDWVEDGMPLAWHFDRLREAGFRSVDCLWRCDCDAIYGGIL